MPRESNREKLAPVQEKCVSTHQVTAALALRFPPGEWATFFEVSDKTGAGSSRRADALAFNCWPSRGLQLHGFEVKVSRRDWVSERNNPDKAQAIQRYCDRWWLVVGDEETVLRPGEVPVTWGLLAMRNGKLFQVKDAPTLEPEPWPRTFIASLLRAASESAVPKEAVSALASKMADERVEYQRRWEREAAAKSLREHERLVERVRAFAESSGIDLQRDSSYAWPRDLADPKRLGAAVQYVLKRGIDAHHLPSARHQVAALLEAIDAVIKLSEAFPPVAALSRGDGQPP